MSSTRGPVLALVEHDRGSPAETAFQALAFAGAIAAGLGAEVHAVVVGEAAAPLSAEAARHGASCTWVVRHPILSDFAPEAWGDAVVQLARSVDAAALVSTGTDKGNEVLAHAAAVEDLPFAANVVAIDPRADQPWPLTRLRWGGSLLEEAMLDAPRKILSAAPHVFTASATGDHGAAIVDSFTPELADDAARTRVADRVTLASGSSLAGATVVVSGGRGVGSPEGFAALEELAGLIGGAVGCSRVATNNGWRPHADQVGQTGKRIAPELYIACGISGAIQHWVGMMAAKRVLAINIDRDAPMVMKADYAIIGDLHAVLPAVIAEIRQRRESGQANAQTTARGA